MATETSPSPLFISSSAKMSILTVVEGIRACHHALTFKDLQSGKEGITLGGILIFGTEELIHAALPHYRTDAILRRVNLDRYDDRDDIRVNLLENYDALCFKAS
ncbi:MAG: hypothetical protein WC151_12220 [Bacteroidales bacterium]